MPDTPLRHAAYRLGPTHGCRLVVGEWGDPSGWPVFYCHGFPSSRLEAALAARAARRIGIRLLAPDRPGYGESAFVPDRRIGDWAGTIAAVADALGLGRFSLLGVSGGGPYALAGARFLPPERLRACAVVAGLGPLAKMHAAGEKGFRYRNLFRLAHRLGYSCGHLLGEAVPPLLRRHPTWVLGLLTLRAPAADRRVLARRRVRHVVLAAQEHAFRQGGRGPVHDFLLYGHPWGFALEDIVRPVTFWQGDADAVVPPAMGRYQAERLPACDYRELPGEAHFSLATERTEEVLAALMP